MSRKSLKSMKDENQDLQKQIGCITGFFQLFDRHRFLAGHAHHKPTSGGSSNDIKDLHSTMHKQTAKNQRVAREKQQFSTESSITSMTSSSCSSSMSSIEFNRTIQTGSLSTGQKIVPENQSSEFAVKQPLDFYDIVKDSMHRESQALSVKTAPKEQKKGQTPTLKYIDSPRPLPPHKSVNSGVTAANEVFHSLAKSKKTPWDSPRFSYDGRDTQDTFRTATKHKELPRLSLDSKQLGSVRPFNEGNKSHNLLKDPQKGHVRNSSATLNEPQEPETSRRSSSVVAKLMGLEGLPDCTQTCNTTQGTTCCSSNKNELLGRSRTSDEYKLCRGSVSPRPQSRKADLITNVTPYNRFALESSSWRQPDASQSSQVQVPKGSESDVKASKPYHSVYGEIDKRVAELEFKKSGKDLRALKQILEAMQRYKDSYNTTSDQATNSPSENKSNSSLNQSSKVQSPRLGQKDQTSDKTDISNTSQGSQLPIVIMKTARVTRKANSRSSTEMPIRSKSGRLVDKQTAKGISSTNRNIKEPYSQQVRSADKSNNMRTSKSTRSSKVPQESCGIVTSSPRIQKKFGLERRSPPSSPSSVSSINRRQHNRNSVEFSSSPSNTPRQKFSALQGGNECSGDISCHWSDFKHRVNVISADNSGIEVIHIDQSGNITSTSIQLSALNQNIAVKYLSKGSSKAETIVTAEQPSPVSVLDAAFYREDPPSPVRKKSDISEDSGEALSVNDDDSEENSMDLPLSNTTKANFSTRSCARDLSTQNLVQILHEIDWSDEKFISFSDRKDPEHKYIAEILLASGQLNGPTSSQISLSPGHLINPKMFFALEEMKTNKRNLHIEDGAKRIGRITDPEQMQRKLVFDVVNDILVQKFHTMWCLPNELAGRKLEGKQLLDKLCTEIDQLQPHNKNDFSMADEEEILADLLWGDLMHHSAVWTNCCIEMPNVVLDIERLIFKDLITEVVRGEVTNNLGRHCRQLLFSK